jgi:hypothetical protein
MKIRLEILLLAAVLVAVAFAARAQTAPELRISYYERWTEGSAFRVCQEYPTTNVVLQENYSYDNLWYDPLDNGIWLTQWSWDECYLRLLHRDESWSQTSWPCCANIHDDGEKQWWLWAGDTYSEGVSPVAPFSSQIPWGKRDYTNIAHNIEGNFEWDDVFTDRYETRIELLTGGQTNLANSALFQLAYGAEDSASGQPIDPTNISALGKTADTNGQIWKALSDHVKVDATPALPAAFKNYIFAASFAKRIPQLLRNGTNITDTSQTVIVGERLNLSVVLDVPVAPITNFSWSIPGNIVSNYIADLNHAKVYYVSNFTSSTITFCWRDSGTNLTVQCSIIVKGEALVAKAKFNVIRPSADFTGFTNGIVEVDTNHVQGLTLHFGRATLANYGMRFVYANTNLNGWQGGAIFSGVQVGTLEAKHNLPNGKSYLWTGSGCDTDYPAKTFGFAPDFFDDSPHEAVSGSVKVWRTDTFQTYLLFQPDTPASIVVPLKKVEWNWSGIATNVSGGWVLLKGTNAITLNNASVTSHPEWITNAFPGTFTTNMTWYP